MWFRSNENWRATRMPMHTHTLGPGKFKLFTFGRHRQLTNAREAHQTSEQKRQKDRTGQWDVTVICIACLWAQEERTKRKLQRSARKMCTHSKDDGNSKHAFHSYSIHGPYNTNIIIFVYLRTRMVIYRQTIHGGALAALFELNCRIRKHLYTRSYGGRIEPSWWLLGNHVIGTKQSKENAIATRLKLHEAKR